MLTEKVFNDLVFTPVVNNPWFPQYGTPMFDGKIMRYETSRFSYVYDTESKTGTGYMDILLDEYNEIHDKTFRLILSGEVDGQHRRQRCGSGRHRLPRLYDAAFRHARPQRRQRDRQAHDRNLCRLVEIRGASGGKGGYRPP